MIACATIVAKSFLSFARVLGRSLREHHPALPFVVVLADEIDGVFQPDAEAFEVVPLDRLDIPTFAGCVSGIRAPSCRLP